MLAVQDVTRHKGIPTTSPARTLVDLAATLDYRSLRRAVREAQRRLITTHRLLDTLDRLGPRRGVTELARILAAGPAPTRSELEDAVLDLIHAGGLVIEADGAAWHDGRLARLRAAGAPT